MLLGVEGVKGGWNGDRSNLGKKDLLQKQTMKHPIVPRPDSRGKGMNGVRISPSSLYLLYPP